MDRLEGILIRVRKEIKHLNVRFYKDEYNDECMELTMHDNHPPFVIKDDFIVGAIEDPYAYDNLIDMTVRKLNEMNALNNTSE